MTYDVIAPFLWFGFLAGCIVGWTACAGVNALERWIIKRFSRPAQRREDSRT